MNSSQLSYQDVLQLVELISGSSAFSELRIRSGDVEIDLRRSGASTPSPAAPASIVPTAPVPVSVESKAPTPTGHRAPTIVNRDGMQTVKAPMVGTIYRAPEPGAEPFITVGQRVAAGDQLGIIEVMKLMNPIRADGPGIVSEILVVDGQSVEFGQELFVITPG